MTLDKNFEAKLMAEPIYSERESRKYRRKCLHCKCDNWTGSYQMCKHCLDLFLDGKLIFDERGHVVKSTNRKRCCAFHIEGISC